MLILPAASLPYTFAALTDLTDVDMVSASDGSTLTIRRSASQVVLLDEQQQWHNPDGPAVIYAGGTRGWCLHGVNTRLDGPALERSDGTALFFIDGEMVDADDPRLMLGGELA